MKTKKENYEHTFDEAVDYAVHGDLTKPSLSQEGVEGCCSAQTLYNFPNDNEFNNAISSIMTNSGASKTAATRALVAELATQFEDTGDHLTLAFLSEHQSIAAKILVKENGFKVIGKYRGREGVISILAAGLLPTRS
jgi:hypothetical protein